MNIHGSIVSMARLRSTQVIPTADFDPTDSQKQHTNTSRKDRSFNIEIMTKQDINYPQTCYYR